MIGSDGSEVMSRYDFLGVEFVDWTGSDLSDGAVHGTLAFVDCEERNRQTTNEHRGRYEIVAVIFGVVPNKAGLVRYSTGA